jgi:hypothetical protein
MVEWMLHSRFPSESNIHEIPHLAVAMQWMTMMMMSRRQGLFVLPPRRAAPPSTLAMQRPPPRHVLLLPAGRGGRRREEGWRRPSSRRRTLSITSPVRVVWYNVFRDSKTDGGFPRGGSRRAFFDRGIAIYIFTHTHTHTR